MVPTSALPTLALKRKRPLQRNADEAGTSRGNAVARPVAEQWKTVNDISTDSRKHEFRFAAARKSGVADVLPAQASALECLNFLLSDDCMDYILDMINSYADAKVAKNVSFLFIETG